VIRLGLRIGPCENAIRDAGALELVKEGRGLCNKKSTTTNAGFRGNVENILCIYDVWLGLVAFTKTRRGESGRKSVSR
jgi:hypothetical protein